jgi:hypothetical protein
MTKRIALFALSLATGGAHASDVYQNTTNRVGTVHALLGAGMAGSPERGNAITLGGTDRVASRFEWKLRIGDSGVATFDTVIRLYANDGPGGGPGTRLWDSGPRRTIIDSGADLTYSATLPPIALPDTLTWTVQVTGRTGSNQSVMGPPHFNPPVVGSAPFGYWERTAQGSWVSAGPDEPPFGARLVATACVADCDASGPVNIGDVLCFLQRFAAGDAGADCDGSGRVDVQDFLCFLVSYAAGC